MATSSTLNIFLIISLFLLLPLLASCTEKQSYIVYFGEHKGDKTVHEIEDTHLSYLRSVKNDEVEARDSLIYSYKHSINGFAARLTPEEASKFSEMEEVVTVIRSYPRKYTLQTTRSWDFIGLGSQAYKHFTVGGKFMKKAKYGRGVIVGMIDSGVWPESQSFHDEGMGPIPKHWKGSCQDGALFNSSNCNRKLIGAKHFVKGFNSYFGPVNASEDCLSPRDLDGHGTHTASTVAGRRVFNAAAIGGYGRGTATGGAPLAHIAIYKACWAIPNQMKAFGNTCFDEDMLAAMDEAANDGVDVISMSISYTSPVPFDQDSIALGGLHAVKKNVVVVCAGGNSGPAPSTVSNPAPWIITVAASSTDRKFSGSLVLGNGKHFSGETVTPFKMDKPHPLVYAGDVGLPNVTADRIGLCLPDSLDPQKVKGKVVLCFKGGPALVLKGIEVKRAGGVGMILGNSKNLGDELIPSAHVLPTTELVYNDGLEIFNYIKHKKFPTAMIGKARSGWNNKPTPYMAPFSGRGPNAVDPNILKPDITAPGLNILAAWSEGSTISKETNDDRVVSYNFDSGTSMATPHVAAAAALLRAIHPKWSNAAIRSALMTTASLRNNKGQLIRDIEGAVADPFQYGSGHFMPMQAALPGLVYDSSYRDYLLYLCSIGVKNLDRSFTCPKTSPSPVNLNYPSIAISKFNGSATVTRTVTNVGYKNTAYFFTSSAPSGVKVTATPSVLIFNHVGQKQTFTITVTGNPTKVRKANNNADHVFAWYKWTDKKHHVKSPIAISLV